MLDARMVRGWEQSLEELQRWIGRRFKRAEPRERAYRYVKGLLSNVARKNGWQLAEQAGITDLRLLEQRTDLASAWADSSAGGALGRVWWNIAGYHLRLTVAQGKVRQQVYEEDRALRSVPAAR